MERVPQLVRRGKKDRRMGAPSELDRSLSTPVRHSWELIREQSPVS